MSTLRIRDADGNIQILQVSGAGTEANPFLANHVLVDINGDPITVEHNAVSVVTQEHATTFTIEIIASGSSIALTPLQAPGSGSKLAIYNYCISTDSSAGVVALDFVTSLIPVARLYASKDSQSSDCPVHIIGAVDESISILGTGLTNGAKVFITINHADHT